MGQVCETDRGSVMCRAAGQRLATVTSSARTYTRVCGISFNVSSSHLLVARVSSSHLLVPDDTLTACRRDALGTLRSASSMRLATVDEHVGQGRGSRGGARATGADIPDLRRSETTTPACRLDYPAAGRCLNSEPGGGVTLTVDPVAHLVAHGLLTAHDEPDISSDTPYDWMRRAIAHPDAPGSTGIAERIADWAGDLYLHVFHHQPRRQHAVPEEGQLFADRVDRCLPGGDITATLK